jgi:hypothetical protein|tara:strand:- start:1162 stop:1599 length:438 start_codon:yes stop_codon:yes gene_type:complete
MIQVSGFLSKDTCEYCIQFFTRNQNVSRTFRGRFIIDLLTIKDPVIDSIKQKYVSLYPTKKLKTLELISWGIGESHDWHDDTIYYDHSTILYLNDNYEGGRTQIQDYVIQPKAGKLICFTSDLKHRVTTLKSGQRYVILAWYKNG